MSDPWDDPEVQRWTDHVRCELIPMIEGSSVAVSLCPPDGKTDVKFAVELGMMIMLNKPIIVVANPGQTVPPKLVMVADRVVHADITTADGRLVFMKALEEFAHD
jgi:hypothetical protein